MQANHAPAQARRVLIVDDSRAIQAIIRRALEAPEMGPIDIQTANDGAEALDKVGNFKPDLVLSDWHMPGVSGIEMLQTLRQTGHHGLPVGFITTETGDDTLLQARSNGAAFVLNKPFDPQTLQRMVASNLARPQAESVPDPDLPTPRRKTEPRGPAALSSMAQVQQFLFAHLGTRSFDLTRLASEGLPDFALQSPQLIALYASPGRKGAYAIAMLDAAACCLVGGMAAGLTASEIQAMRAAERPSPSCVEHATRFMRAMADTLVRHDVNDHPTLNTARLALQPFEKLQTLLQNNRGRSDLHVRVPQVGDGHMSFVLV